MISSPELRHLTEGRPGPVLVDAEGDQIDLEGLPVDATAPGLLVTPITEAVKEVDEGRVAHYLSRDTLWAVDGFLLDGDLIAELPDDVASGAELISAVREGGREWHIIHRG